MKNTQPQDLQYEFLKFTLPEVNFEDFEIVRLEETRNVSRRSDLYDTRLLLTIEEKNIPPDKSWKRYAHGFVEKQINDWPVRSRALSIIIKTRRRKNKITGKTIVSDKEGVIVLEGTKKPEDVLTFLK